MAVVCVVWAGAPSATATRFGHVRAVPDEIIVKFRPSVADCSGRLTELAKSDELPLGHGLRNLRDRYRVRQMTPLLRDFDRQQARLETVRAHDELRWMRKQRYLSRDKRLLDTGREPDLGRIYRVRLDLEAGQSLEEVLAAYRSCPDVEYAERNPTIAICATPSDPLYAQQWALSKIQAAEAWETCRGGHDIVVAVIDTGVDYDHRDLRGNVWINEAEATGEPELDDDDNGYVDDIYGYNFAYNNNDPADDHGHGTKCAGIIAAAGDNSLDITGVCWTARIMSLKILGSDGDGSAADAVPAIYYAVANGADIISGSWGGEDPSEAIKEAIEYAHREGVIVVAAAGNEGSDTPFYPAAYSSVLAVAATESDDRRWYLSNYGDWVDIAAPGRNILSIRPEVQSADSDEEEFTGRTSGTSMAAPHVSGACALLLSANPLLTRDEVEQLLLSTADPIAAGICASNGRLNVYKALRAAIPPEGTIRLDRAHYAESVDIGVLLADWDLRGAGRQPVLMESAGGDIETLILTETEVSLGVFRGMIASTSAAVRPDDGVLQVQHGENIYARYVDGDDGSGQEDRWRQAVAPADYEPPVVSDLKIETQRAGATIQVVTSEPTVAEIRYGTICGGPYDLVVKGSGLTDRHEIELRRLIPQMRYCFIVSLTDAAGNEAIADDGGQGYSLVAEGSFRGFRVPEAYPTLQAAIDEAGDGETIWVADGTYSGEGNLEVDFFGKAITVRSENGPASCIIDCEGRGRAFHFHSGETAASVLDGFTISNGGNVDYGGGIRCVGSSPTIRNCIVIKNSASQYGGGLCNCYGSHPAITNCTFQENSCASFRSSGRGGGMANRHGSGPVVTDCTFISNSAWYSAGGLGNFDGSSPRVTGCTFTGNSSEDSGGAIGNWDDSRPTFERCVFTKNRAKGSGGAVANRNGGEAAFVNCVFSGNVADRDGGAITDSASEVVLANCTISGNHAERSCGGIRSTGGSDVRLANCILWGNTGGDSGGQAESAQIVVSGGVDIRYCCVQGWSGALDGFGNLGCDPLFVDSDGGDFHLKSQAWRWDRLLNRWTYDAVTSPCIDAGNPGWPLGDEPATVPDDPDHAAAVNPRINMGAYGGTAEASLASSGWALLADMNNDDAVDWLDLAHMTAVWMRPGPRYETDLSRDGRTATADFTLLARQWCCGGKAFGVSPR